MKKPASPHLSSLSQRTGRARGLVSGRTSGSRVEARRHAPPSDLSGVVENVWTGEWDLRGEPPHTTKMLSDPCVHLVFEGTSSRVVGVWTRLWTRTLEDRGRVRGVKLHPGAVRAFLPEAAARYRNRRVPLADALGPVPPLLVARVVDSDDEAALAALFGWLRAKRRTAPGLAQAVRAMERARDEGHTRVASLAEACGVSERALQRLFHEHVGATPKWVLRRLRLQEVAQRVESGEAPDLADLAAQLGYADQAHLARDFRTATGSTLRHFERRVHAE